MNKLQTCSGLQEDGLWEVLSVCLMGFVCGGTGKVQAADECSAVLELDARHTGALMLRAQTLVAMKDYHSALFDVNRLLELNPSSEVYHSLQARLRTQLVCHYHLHLEHIHLSVKVFGRRSCWEGLFFAQMPVGFLN